MVSWPDSRYDGTMTEYIPVDCALYSRYELAILHHQRFRLSWSDAAGEVHIAMLTLRDLQTRAGAEYLIAQDQAGQRLELRLDRIQHADVV